MTNDDPGESSAKPHVLVSAGTSWYAWNFRRRLLEAMAEAGWRVTVLAPRDEHSLLLASLPGLQWRDWKLSLFGSALHGEFGSLLNAASVLREERPNFVLNHGIKPNIYLGLACRLFGIPYANSVTGLGMRVQAGGLGAVALARLYAMSCNAARQLFIQNFDDLERLKKAGLSSRVPVTRTMGSGVDLDHFSFQPMPGEGTPRTFLFAGRLQRDKGIYEFAEAARAIRKQFSDTRFLVAGSFRHANRDAVPQATLLEWEEQGSLELIGHQNDIRPWITKAHTLVLPSHGGEGIPKVMLEAAALGRPVIASDVAGCRDAIRLGITGAITRPMDASDLITAISSFVGKSDSELAEMGQAARQDAEKRFSDEELIARTLAVLETLKN